jgi:hypothetical protein
MVEISRAERVGAKFPAYPCSSVLIRGRLNLLCPSGKKSKPSKPNISVLVGMVEISRAERVGGYVSVFPCKSVLIRGWHTSPHAPRPLRHFPDTYPIHSRHIPDTYVYATNTQRIPRECPMNTPKRLQKCF